MIQKEFQNYVCPVKRMFVVSREKSFKKKYPSLGNESKNEMEDTEVITYYIAGGNRTNSYPFVRHSYRNLKVN